VTESRLAKEIFIAFENINSVSKNEVEIVEEQFVLEAGQSPGFELFGRGWTMSWWLHGGPRFS